MDTPSFESRTSILQWDETDVHIWFSKLGFPQYESQIRGASPGSSSDKERFSAGVIGHNISGDVLCLLDAEGLKEVGIATIGQRLAILKGVYNIKLAQGIPIEADHYVPPCENTKSLCSDADTHTFSSRDRGTAGTSRCRQVV